nr:hypothetical protein [Cupriavidus taiwanensis]
MHYDGNGQPLASTLADYMLPGRPRSRRSASIISRRRHRIRSSAPRGWARAGDRAAGGHLQCRQ